MAAPHFDRLVQTWAATGSRRGLLSLLAALPGLAPLLSLLTSLFGDESAAARRRHQTRQGRDSRRQQVQDERKKKKKRKKKKTLPAPSAPASPLPSPPAPCAQSCAGCCDGESCRAGTSAEACGRNGASCAICANPIPVCTGQVCAACTVSTQCPAGMLCHDGQCQECDVCDRGCRYFVASQALFDPDGPATVRVCPGTQSGNFQIRRDVHLIGAGNGDGAGDTIFAGPGDGHSVVTIKEGLSVTLQNLRITGGAISGNGGGILTSASLVTLKDCIVTGNRAALGGGILSTLNGTVTLDHCDVTNNTASAGGGVYNNVDATLTLLNGSRISGNRATNPIGNNGGGVLNGGTLHPTGGTIMGNTPDDCYDSVNGTGCPPQ